MIYLQIIFLCISCISFSAPQTQPTSDEKVEVSGVVKDAKGNSVEGVTVKFYRDHSSGSGAGTKFSGLVPTAMTNEKGEWHIKLAPGDYRYSVGNKTIGHAGGKLTVARDKQSTLDIMLSDPEKH